MNHPEQQLLQFEHISIGRHERRQRALEQLKLVGLDGFADALPNTSPAE